MQSLTRCLPAVSLYAEKRRSLLAMYSPDFSLPSVNHKGTLPVISPRQHPPKDTAFIPEAVLKKQHAFIPNLNYCVHTSASHFSCCMQSWQCHPTLPVLTFLGLLPTDKGKKPYPTVTEPSVMTRTVEFCTAFTITSGLPARSTHFPFSVTDLTRTNYLW